MLFLVHQHAADDAADFVDRIAELQPAILDVHAGAAVRHVAAVDIGDAAGRRAAVPAVLSVTR